MLVHHIILAMLWIVYCILHSAMASVSLKKKLKLKLGSSFKYYRLFYSVLAFLLLAGVLYYQISIPTYKLLPGTLPVLLPGIIFTVSGLSLMMICIKKYFVSLSGLLSVFEENPSNTLIINGVHRFIRHPLYSGTFVFIWGLFLLFPFVSLLIADTIITVYTLIGIGFEENKLIAEFGESYVAYKKQVPKLIPSFKPKEFRKHSHR